MNCKNCDKSLRTDHGFCPFCGAKIIRNRLTFKNLWYDITERYFNIDNTFLKTFWHLFTKPEQVIGGYIEGVRKKYLNPVSYFGIALTLSGILVFLIKNFFIEDIDFSNNFQGNEGFADKWKNITFDYSSLFFVSYLPLLTLASFISFNKRKFNLTEHFVLALYVLAHYSIISFPLSLICFLFFPDGYMTFSQIFMLVVFIYFIYVLQKANQYKPGILILRSMLFSTMMVILFFVLIIAVMILMYATGVFTPADFEPPK